AGRLWLVAARLLVDPPGLRPWADRPHGEPDVSTLAWRPAAALSAGADGNLGDCAPGNADRRRAGVSRGLFGGQKRDSEHLRPLSGPPCPPRLPRPRP